MYFVYVNAIPLLGFSVTDLSGPCTVTSDILYCASPSCMSLCQSYLNQSDETWIFPHRGIMVATWFREMMTQATKS
jgi:hypothetical protein